MQNNEQKKKQLLELLNIHYGYKALRPGQEKAIDSLLDGKNVVVILPTGGGKSMCFQLPALVMDGVTIVISPLIALMKDQVDSLTRVGIPATFINSSVAPNDVSARLEAVKNGHFKLLYIAPERFYNNEFIQALAKIKVSLFAIDEAHCISSWGHDFRPSYVKLRQAIERVGNPQVIALTATATKEVRDDIIKQLGLEKPELVVTGFDRPNLTFSVVRSNEGSKPHYVLEAIRSIATGTGVVYVSTRSRADQLLQVLVDNGIEAIGYHAGMDANERKWVQESFIANKARVIVATNAFGLGIDKSDVRFVIHYDMPGTIEAYYQEAGRAGRDGKPSNCLLLYNSRDRILQEFFIKGDNPSPELIIELYEMLLSFENDRLLVTYSDLQKQLNTDAPDMAIGTAVKILEKEGLIRRSQDHVGSAYLKIFKPYNQLEDIFGTRGKKNKELLEKLFNRFGEDLLNGFDLNLEEVANIFEVKKDTVRRLIKKLEENGLAEFKPPFKGTEINIIKRLMPSEVNLDFKALKEKLAHSYDKLDRMENYVYHKGCRPGYIIEYFGGTEVKPCGKCDNCLDGLTSQVSMSAIDAIFDSGVNETASVEGFNTKLTQLETYELYEKKLSIGDMAQTRNLKPATIVDHLCFLIHAKKTIDIARFVTAEKISAISEVINKVGAGKLALIKEAVDETVTWDEIKLVLANHLAK
ncbi:MAG: RecQ family ATP-dependent DNA helicase [bacterium]